MKLEMTTKQVREVKMLVKSECANYWDGGCVLLDSECPQLTCETALCNYFKDSVLPLNPELEHELLGGGYYLTCPRCERKFFTKKPNTKYCKLCAKFSAQEKRKEYMRRTRKAK